MPERFYSLSIAVICQSMYAIHLIVFTTRFIYFFTLISDDISGMLIYRYESIINNSTIMMLKITIIMIVALVGVVAAPTTAADLQC